jgi:Zn-dependent protease with chaperone function
MAGQRRRLWPALLATVVAAGAATIVLRPRGGLIEPAAIELTAYFSPAELDRSADFRDFQRVLSLAGMALSGGTLALLALRPPRVRNGAAAGAAISLVLVVVGLPLAVWRHERAVDAGLSTQSLGPWLGDVAKSAGIGAVFAALGGALVIWLIRRFPTRWWVPSAGVVVGFAVITLYLSPVVIDPLFNKFEPLPRGQLRSDVLNLADRAGVDVGEVYRVDASRRTTSVNAYVGGLGHTKRVVLYDNLIEDFPRDQVRSVVAHELGHVESRDIPRGILWIAIVAPAGTFLLQRLAERVAGEGVMGAGVRPDGRALPALALALALVSFGLGSAGNALSRPVEARADAFALELTKDPRAFIELERGLTVRNLGDPDPPRLLHLLFGTHPTTRERLGVGVRFGR